MTAIPDAWLDNLSGFNLGAALERSPKMTTKDQTSTPEGPKSEQFREYIRERQLEMLSEELWDEFLWGELGAARRDFDTAEWGKNQERASNVPLQ